MGSYTYFYDEKEHKLYIYDGEVLVKVYPEVLSAEEAADLFEEYLDKEAIVTTENGLYRS